MKGILVLSFLFIFLAGNTAVKYLLRVPILFYHYVEDIKWNDDPSLIDFLATHYVIQGHHANGKQHDHEKLPLKVGDCDASQLIILVPHLFFSLPQVLFKAFEANIAIYSQQKYVNSFLKTIWQPPRFS